MWNQSFVLYLSYYETICITSLWFSLLFCCGICFNTRDSMNYSICCNRNNSRICCHNSACNNSVSVRLQKVDLRIDQKPIVAFSSFSFFYSTYSPDNIGNSHSVSDSLVSFPNPPYRIYIRKYQSHLALYRVLHHHYNYRNDHHECRYNYHNTAYDLAQNQIYVGDNNSCASF